MTSYDSTSGLIDNDEWTHVAVTISKKNSDVSFYKNGEYWS